MHRAVRERDRADEVGQREREVRGALDEPREPPAVAHGEQRDRQRQQRAPRAPRRDAEQDVVRRRGPEELQVARGGRARRAAALGEPADQHADRDADADRDHGGEERQHRQRPAPELVADGRPPRAAADPGVVRVAAQPRLAEQQHDAEDDREERERGGARRAEAEPVLRVDVERERLEPAARRTRRTRRARRAPPAAARRAAPGGAAAGRRGRRSAAGSARASAPSPRAPGRARGSRRPRAGRRSGSR